MVWSCPTWPCHVWGRSSARVRKRRAWLQLSRRGRRGTMRSVGLLPLAIALGAVAAVAADRKRATGDACALVSNERSARAAGARVQRVRAINDER
eukprot:scaffold101476_cov69-Phaeocystis_antarctica.AAC.2